jgi:hypothetical protein
MLVQGRTSGGTTAEIVTDDRVNAYCARLQSISRLPIEWTITPTTATTINDAMSQLSTTTKES